MPDIHIKTPNLDAIFEKWKNSMIRKNKKKMEKEFGTKGAVFSLNAISAAEYVKSNMKEAAIYFAIKKTITSATGKDLIVVSAPNLSRETFYTFQGKKINKQNWKGKDKVPIFESIKAIPCKKCGGKGYLEFKCTKCGGKGKISEVWNVIVGEEQKKMKKNFNYSCNICYGTGKIREMCKQCNGYKNEYQYSILPVPFKTIVSGIPILHSSARTKYEKEIEQGLHNLIKEVDGIKFNDFKTLESKAEASLGYWNKNIKKTINSAKNDYQNYQKDENTKIISQIYLFPMIQLFCETKRGNKFEIYSLGSANRFMIYSNF
ncbi:MAG: hypothetical protein ACTSPD_04915 [Promethearchaeota archaeon]